MLGLGTILFTAWRVRQLRKIPLKKCLDFWQKKERIKKGQIVKGAIRLPYPVRFLLDEFANIGQIPDFTKKTCNNASI